MKQGDIIYGTLFIKELTSVDELVKENSKLPKIVKIIICYIKKIFCILTITKERNMYIAV